MKRTTGELDFYLRSINHEFGSGSGSTCIEYGMVACAAALIAVTWVGAGLSLNAAYSAATAIVSAFV